MFTEAGSREHSYHLPTSHNGHEHHRTNGHRSRHKAWLLAGIRYHEGCTVRCNVFYQPLAGGKAQVGQPSPIRTVTGHQCEVAIDPIWLKDGSQFAL